MTQQRQSGQARNKRRPIALIGIDTGGTFTDFTVIDAAGQLRTLKRLSTPDDPARAIIDGLRELQLADKPARIIHGSTVATNAVLENKLARTAFITNEGFADLLLLGRQNREQIYELCPPRLDPPVPAELCIEAPVRCAGDGAVIRDELGEQALAAITAKLEALGAEAAAVCLLFSWRNGEHERRLQQHLQPSWPVSLSAEILPQIGEYERAVATWLNAALSPVVGRYLANLSRALPKARIAIMQSTGRTMAAAYAAARPVNLLLSGPAGGMAAVAALAAMGGAGSDSPAGHQRRLLSFDMGGTSTDVAMVAGRPVLTSRGRIGRWPVAVPMVDMHTIGAGGGSIAWLDEAGALQVGPHSAGADPGPACYRQGGEQPTVTDAHMLLGRLPEAVRLGGFLELSREHAESAFRPLAKTLGQTVEQIARDVITLADEHMARALQLMSASRGHDPAAMQLVCFGGAGGLHVCSLAERLGMRRAMMPVHAGVLSALGMLLAPAGRELTRSILAPLSEADAGQVSGWLDELARRARAELHDEGIDPDSLVIRRQLDCCYHGQKDIITLDWHGDNNLADAGEDFHERHEQLNGHRLQHQIMLVNLRISASAEAALERLPDWPHADRGKPGSQSVIGHGEAVPVYQRAMLSGAPIAGPAIVMDDEATLWLAPGWRAKLDRYGNILLDAGGDA